MSSTVHLQKLPLPKLTLERLANFCGLLHENITLIEKHFNLHIKISDNDCYLQGENLMGIQQAERILKQLYPQSRQPILPETVLSLLNHQQTGRTMSQSIHLSRKTIAPRNQRQAEYLKSIEQHDMTFAIGPAGTGKTYLAVSKALEYFTKGQVQRLVFVRPAVEAGEKLGFLPGDLVEKVLPYLRPIYDALYEMLGFKETQKLIQSDVIEILPLAFMRGRTLNEAFIILDEAQNTTIMQMKMFLTRMGFGSKAVITGDLTQIDLPKGVACGLQNAIKLLAGVEEIAVHRFTSQEVVRHPLVSKVVDCYDAYESFDSKDVS